MEPLSPSGTDQYLRRIGYHGERSPTSTTLRELQRAHLLTVPFENLDIVRGIPRSLELPNLFDKIVARRRGGFCYELNGLFTQLLLALGFEVTLLSASDAHEDDGFGPEFDHLVLQVRCADDGSAAPGWLVDVGWGDTFRDPLHLMPGVQQEQDGRTFCLQSKNDRLLLWMREVDGAEERQYAFSLQPHRFEDFLPMFHYHQTSPHSMFTQHRLCTQALVNGRVTLRDLRFTQTHAGVRDARDITEEDFAPLLFEHFGIVW